MEQTDCSKCDRTGRVECPQFFWSQLGTGFAEGIDQLLFILKADECSLCDDEFKIECDECGGTGAVDDDGDNEQVY